MGYATLTAICIYIEWKVYTPLLQFLILFYGVCVGLYAVADIHDDTIVRTVERSDAYACYKEVWPCCNPKCVGLQWALLAIIFQLMGIWIAVAEMSDECENLGWFQCLHIGSGGGGGGEGGGGSGSQDWNLFETFQDWDFEGFWEQNGVQWNVGGHHFGSGVCVSN